MNAGVIDTFYGTKLVDSKSLPERCQRELIEVFKPAIQKRIIKANKQIKASQAHFRLANPKGLLILVNDGNYALEADAALWLVWRILGTSFKNINTVVYCTVNMFASAPYTTRPTLVWVNASRASVVDPIEDAWIDSLFSGWSKHVQTVIGGPMSVHRIGTAAAVESIRAIKYIKQPAAKTTERPSAYPRDADAPD
jgi:hypothetical protein